MNRSDATATSAGDQSSSTAQSAFVLPGRQLSVLPIGLGIFAGVSVLALVVSHFDLNKTSELSLNNFDSTRLLESLLMNEKSIDDNIELGKWLNRLLLLLDS